MDDDYLASRVQSRSSIKKEGDHLGHGILRGATGLGMGVAKGVTGVVMSPMQEAGRDGIKGFVKGVGKGAIGAVVKPTVGLVDLAEELSTGLKNSASLIGAADGPLRRGPSAILPPPFLSIWIIPIGAKK